MFILNPQPAHSLSIFAPFFNFTLAKMLSTITVLALALAAQAAPAPAIPATSVAGSKSFSVQAVHNPNFVRNGTAALLKAYKKWNLKATKELPDAFKAELSGLSKRQDGSAPASPTGDEYLVPVSVGGQTLNLDFDTGSADL